MRDLGGVGQGGRRLLIFAYSAGDFKLLSSKR